LGAPGEARGRGSRCSPRDGCTPRGGGSVTTREARLAAEAWVREEGVRTPGFVGAMMVGSIGERAPDDPHPPGSDVDVWVVVDGPVPDARRDPPSPLWPDKLAFHGVVLERAHFSWELLRNPEAVLADENLAPTVVRSRLLSDPSGLSWLPRPSRPAAWSYAASR